MDEQKLDQLSLDAEKLMDQLLVTPSPSRSKSKPRRRKSLIPELDNVSSSDSDSDISDASDIRSMRGSRRGSVMGKFTD